MDDEDGWSFPQVEDEEDEDEDEDDRMPEVLSMRLVFIAEEEAVYKPIIFPSRRNDFVFERRRSPEPCLPPRGTQGVGLDSERRLSALKPTEDLGGAGGLRFTHEIPAEVKGKSISVDDLFDWGCCSGVAASELVELGSRPLSKASFDVMTDDPCSESMVERCSHLAESVVPEVAPRWATMEGSRSQKMVVSVVAPRWATMEGSRSQKMVVSVVAAGGSMVPVERGSRSSMVETCDRPVELNSRSAVELLRAGSVVEPMIVTGRSAVPVKLGSRTAVKMTHARPVVERGSHDAGGRRLAINQAWRSEDSRLIESRGYVLILRDLRAVEHSSRLSVNAENPPGEVELRSLTVDGQSNRSLESTDRTDGSEGKLEFKTTGHDLPRIPERLRFPDSPTSRVELWKANESCAPRGEDCLVEILVPRTNDGAPRQPCESEVVGVLGQSWIHA